MQSSIQEAVPKPKRRLTMSSGDAKRRRALNALHPRDLRAVDLSLNVDKKPSVVVRQHVIICNLPPRGPASSARVEGAPRSPLGDNTP